MVNNKSALAILLLLGSAWAFGQQSVSNAEKLAADEVAKLVNTTREQSGLPRLRRIGDPHLRAHACERAKHGDESAMTVPVSSVDKVGTISKVLHSTLDPHQPSPELLAWAKRNDGESHRFAAGVCFMHTAGYPEGKYWIEVGSYMGAIKSFFYRAVWD